MTLQGYGLRQQEYADTQLDSPFSAHAITATTKMSAHIQEISSWTKNPGKTKVMLGGKEKCFKELAKSLSPPSIEDSQPTLVKVVDASGSSFPPG